MKFYVIAPRGNITAKSYPSFALRQDNWNDYRFQTQYQLYYLADPASEPVFIDSVKILKKGQTAEDGLLITDDFVSLSNNFCSLGQSLDYYERLSHLGEDVRDNVLTSLKDLVLYPSLAEKFSNEEGWKTSLFRDHPEEYRSELIILAKALLSQDYTKVAAEDLQFSFTIPEWEDEVEFDFTAPSIISSPFSREKEPLPSRVIALIGRNGSGKSTFLSRLARVCHASVSDRKRKLKKVGYIAPVETGFTRIITFSYSAFDSFHLPGISKNEREQIAQDVQEGEGRFIFCGLRDVSLELKQELSKTIKEQAAEGLPDRTNKTLLKPIEVLAEEFVRTLALIEKNGNPELMNTALDILCSDVSFSDFVECKNFSALQEAGKDLYLMCSTGHKIALQIIANLVAYTVPRCLVLLDEPETHLHPPLLASLMHAIRHILDVRKSFCIVATHSPVVVQETLAKHVMIVERHGESVQIKRPLIETFGENIGTLTSEVFGFLPTVTDYHKILRLLVNKFDDIQEIEDLFGSGGLSAQARAYVMSRFAQKG